MCTLCEAKKKLEAIGAPTTEENIRAVATRMLLERDSELTSGGAFIVAKDDPRGAENIVKLLLEKTEELADSVDSEEEFLAGLAELTEEMGIQRVGGDVEGVGIKTALKELFGEDLPNISIISSDGHGEDTSIPAPDAAPVFQAILRGIVDGSTLRVWAEGKIAGAKEELPFMAPPEMAMTQALQEMCVPFAYAGYKREHILPMLKNRQWEELSEVIEAECPRTVYSDRVAAAFKVLAEIQIEINEGTGGELTPERLEYMEEAKREASNVLDAIKEEMLGNDC